MQDFAGFSTALAVLASALGCGLLMGIERERRKGAGRPGTGRGALVHPGRHRRCGTAALSGIRWP
jgi:hypothetical protein